ncbi:MAG: ATP-binding cassette domain-containing protein [Clostridiales bacterium]|nr:ATP-binding cassette domain-containing protein [Clostridiales bacterium]
MELKNITKSYDGRLVLNNFSMKAEKGEIMCLFGPSGCGKTTVLNIIAGLIKADRGEIFENAGKISYVFQEDRLLEWSTCRENIMLTASNKDKADEFIKISGLDDCLDLYPNQMSGGMRKRAAIARAVAYDGDIVLLDEPFNGIDEERAESIAKYLKDFVLDKICILVTHDMHHAKWMDAKIIDFINNSY